MRQVVCLNGARLMALGVLVGLVLPAAPAQSNSLLHRRAMNGRAPTSQPVAARDSANGAPGNAAANGALVSGAADGTAPTGSDIRDILPDKPLKPRKNEVLLAVSPIAVETPEPEKIKLHDQLTIIVRESKTATSDSKMESKKDWKLDTALDKWVRLSDTHGLVPAKFEEGNPAALFNYQNDYKGDGKFDRTDELTTRIQATVIDVKPNGTLVIEASKGIQISENEGYRMTLTGSCRSHDVSPQNTVLSTQIADLDIKVKHNGSVQDATKRGWFQRGLDFLNPF